MTDNNVVHVMYYLLNIEQKEVMEIESLIHEDAITLFFHNVEGTSDNFVGFGCIMVNEFPEHVHGMDVSRLKVTMDTVIVVASKTVGQW